jgi:hypothetical protein
MPDELTINCEGSRNLQVHEAVRLEAVGRDAHNDFEWTLYDTKSDRRVKEAVFKEVGESKQVVILRVPDRPGFYRVEVKAKGAATPGREFLSVRERPLSRGESVRFRGGGPITVDLQRSAIVDTPDLALWHAIRVSTERLGFEHYQRWMERLFCSKDNVSSAIEHFVERSMPAPPLVAYQMVKFATEAFLLTHTGVKLDLQAGFDDELNRRVAPDLADIDMSGLSEEERLERMGLDPGDSAPKLWKRYLEPDEDDDEQLKTLPYLALVRRNLPEWRLELNRDGVERVELCDKILATKFTRPTFLELIWSYWHEEGMLVQTMNAIAARFGNRGSGPRDPLAGLALDSLRPLSNLLWGYIQDESHRLTLGQRVSEYDHEYGLTLFGRAVPRLRSVDPRSRFLEAFHTLLHRSACFYRQDDDTTTIADPFPVLNALRDVHLLLAEGANNMYGDLPWTARSEMLMQQWLLSRSELGDFLPSRVAVAYAEDWMPKVDAMKRVQGWSDTSVRFFHDLGHFGEQIMLSIRFGNWSEVFDREQAGNWARFWRQEVQWYIHAYEAVTGVDLSADTADVRQAQRAPERFTQPAFLLRDRMAEQRRRVTRYAPHAQVGAGNGHEALPGLPAPRELEAEPR